MNKVISVDSRKSKKVLGAYINAQRSERIPDGAIFFAGILMTVILPRIIYAACGGPIPALAFAGLALLGTIIGAAIYYAQPDQTLSRVSNGTSAQASQSEELRTRKAA